jgi:hypothetical protein
MDTTKLKVGQSVFLHDSTGCTWATVISVTPEGVIVETEPCYGDQLIRFDKNGTACDSSDIDVDRYKNVVLFRYGKTEYLVPAPCDRDFDIDRCRNVVAQYNETEIIPRAALHSDIDNYEFRQRFWENFERLKKHSKYSRCSKLKLYLSPIGAGIVLRNGKFIPKEEEEELLSGR